jgi:hypothetical protein
MYNHIKCRKDLDIPDDVTEKLGVIWSDVIFLADSFDGKVGEFLIRSNGQLCHKVAEYEKVDTSESGMPGVVWDGTGYSKIVTTDWVKFEFTGSLETKTTILGKTADADVKINFEVESGYVGTHEVVKLDVMDNAERKAHDKKIKQHAIERAKKMNTWSYRLCDTSIRKPIKYVARGVGYLGSFIQDISWKIEQKLNK